MYLINKAKNTIEKIEHDFGGELIWQRLDDKRASRIKYETPANLLDKTAWDDTIEFMIDGMFRIEKAIKPILGKLGKELKGMKKDSIFSVFL